MERVSRAKERNKPLVVATRDNGETNGEDKPGPLTRLTNLKFNKAIKMLTLMIKMLTHKPMQMIIVIAMKERPGDTLANLKKAKEKI